MYLEFSIYALKVQGSCSSEIEGAFLMSSNFEDELVVEMSETNFPYLTYDQLKAEFLENKKLYFGKQKAYSDGTSTVYIYENGRVKSNHLSNQKSLGSLGETGLTEIREKHMYEIRRKMRDYARNNDFNHFWTLTFAPKDWGSDDDLRYDLMKNWLKKERDKARYYGIEFRYIFVPEYHTGDGQNGGTVHWHGVTGGYTPNLIDSGKKYKNRKIWNCTTWTYGYSNITKVQSKKRVANYMSKYITKDFVNSPVRRGKKKYWASKNLELPNQSFINNKIDLGALEPNFESEFVKIYELDQEQTEKYLGNE